MLCKFGCGQEGAFVQKNGGRCCSIHYTKCPAIKKKIGVANSIALKWHKASEASKEKRRKTMTGFTHSKETIEKIKQSNIEHWKNHTRIPWNKGKKGVQIPWNKGLKKKEPLKILSRDNPVYSNFKKYRNRVAVRTRKTYELFKEEINPNNLPLGKCGITNAYQIDHIISVRIGFELAISVEEISSKENLQIISWEENIQKYDGKGLRKTNNKLENK